MSRAEDNRGCPLHATQHAASLSTNWWPNQLNLKPLKHNAVPLTEDYADEFKKLDFDALKRDIFKLMTTSQDWWPADYGHYGPFFVRMAWHSAGTYRTFDGRGGGSRGNMRFAPLNSWPDNANLDKARRLLWPIKQKYGRKLSWGDLMIFAGNCALESMGLQPFGFAGGRIDLSEPEEDIYWGPEKNWLAAQRGGLGANLHKPLGAVQMGLIYVNPEGPGGDPDPLAAAKDIRETFARMGMNDEETVALIAGGHTFGKAEASKHVGAEPEGEGLAAQGLGWLSRYRSGKGADTITSGLEGAWTANPTAWDNGYFHNLFSYQWTKTKSPAGATQWIPTDPTARELVADAHGRGQRQSPIMFTTDLALREDSSYCAISSKFHRDPALFAAAFVRAWYKLTHRDMGPHSRCLGPLVPPPQLWQDPIPPPPPGARITLGDLTELKARILAHPVLSIRRLVRTAWASASTFRCTDHRGGANGGRLRLAPQRHWAVNDPADLSLVLRALTDIQEGFNASKVSDKPGSSAVSLADLIVLGGCAAVEAAAAAAGAPCVVPFTGGRCDASEAETDVASFAVLEPSFDAFRNFLDPAGAAAQGYEGASPEALLVERAFRLKLSAQEMTALIGGMRVLDANAARSQLGVWTAAPETLSNDFFINLLDVQTVWSPADSTESVFDGRDRITSELRWQGSRVDLVFGSNSVLRAIAETYACADAKHAFVSDFVLAWAKVMNLDRFDSHSYDGNASDLLSSRASAHLRSKL